MEGTMRNAAIGVFAGILGTAVVAVFSQSQSDADGMREVRDRMQIEDLMWRYTRALDANDGDAYAGVYTPDGQFGTGANATKGRDALRKMVADLRQRNADAQAKGEPRPPLYHATANHRISFPGRDQARVEAYYITASGAAGQTTPPRVVAVGRSVDDLVRVNGQWLIKSRNVAPQN
jgi:3-phenylpropionate/cinnamic acid dioxygenase small subunit